MTSLSNVSASEAKNFWDNAYAHAEKGWKSACTETINDIRYAVFNYDVEASGPTLQREKWRELKKINNIYYPLGYIGPTKDDSITRILGYFPICGFWSGLMDVIESIKMIYYRVIRNQNTLNQYEKTQDDQNHLVSIKRHIYKVDLSYQQRAAIFGLSIALFVRGVITFCQIGCIFLPFDLLANRYAESCEY